MHRTKRSAGQQRFAQRRLRRSDLALSEWFLASEICNIAIFQWRIQATARNSEKGTHKSKGPFNFRLDFGFCLATGRRCISDQLNSANVHRGRIWRRRTKVRFSILKSRQMTVALHQDQIAIKWLWQRLPLPLSCGNPLSSHHPHLELGWHFYGNTKNTITRMIGILEKEFLFLFCMDILSSKKTATCT